MACCCSCVLCWLRAYNAECTKPLAQSFQRPLLHLGCSIFACATMSTGAAPSLLLVPPARRFARAPPTVPPAAVVEQAKRQRLMDTLTGIDAEFDVRFMDCFAVEIIGGGTATINRTRHAVYCCWPPRVSLCNTTHITYVRNVRVSFTTHEHPEHIVNMRMWGVVHNDAGRRHDIALQRWWSLQTTPTSPPSTTTRRRSSRSCPASTGRLAPTRARATLAFAKRPAARRPTTSCMSTTWQPLARRAGISPRR